MFGFFGIGVARTDLLTMLSSAAISFALETFIASRVKEAFASVDILIDVIVSKLEIEV